MASNVCGPLCLLLSPQTGPKHTQDPNFLSNKQLEKNLTSWSEKAPEGSGGSRNWLQLQLRSCGSHNRTKEDALLCMPGGVITGTNFWSRVSKIFFLFITSSKGPLMLNTKQRKEFPPEDRFHGNGDSILIPS